MIIQFSFPEIEESISEFFFFIYLLEFFFCILNVNITYLFALIY